MRGQLYFPLTLILSPAGRGDYSVSNAFYTISPLNAISDWATLLYKPNYVCTLFPEYIDITIKA